MKVKEKEKLQKQTENDERKDHNRKELEKERLKMAQRVKKVLDNAEIRRLDLEV